ncbi:hypothetical protein AGI3411_03196 [Achromobacter agilis]|uniref:Uncharacterized protein n=1 Tax=Achromobacter agilis TaxID=1353888 RepID=A0A446CIW1_9BURK|nr:hypothetical protein AGI3411_03196 [Achromobacter agilis]
MDAAGPGLPPAAGPGRRRRHGRGGDAADPRRFVRHRLHGRPRLRPPRRHAHPRQLGPGRVASRRTGGRGRIPPARRLSAPGMAAGPAAHRRQAPRQPARPDGPGHPPGRHPFRARRAGRAHRQPGRSAGRHRPRRGPGAGLRRRRPRHRMGVGRRAVLGFAGAPHHRDGAPYLSRVAAAAFLLVPRQHPRSPAASHVRAGMGHRARHGPAHADLRVRTQRLRHAARRAAGSADPWPRLPGRLRHPMGRLRRAGRAAACHERAAGRPSARHRGAAAYAYAALAAWRAPRALPAPRRAIAPARRSRPAAAAGARASLAGRTAARLRRRAGRPIARAIPDRTGRGRIVLPARLGRRRAVQASGTDRKSLPRRGPRADRRADGGRRTQRNRATELCADGPGQNRRNRRSGASVAAQPATRQRLLADRAARGQPLQTGVRGFPGPLWPSRRL